MHALLDAASCIYPYGTMAFIGKFPQCFHLPTHLFYQQFGFTPVYLLRVCTYADDEVGGRYKQPIPLQQPFGQADAGTLRVVNIIVEVAVEYPYVVFTALSIYIFLK